MLTFKVVYLKLNFILIIQMAIKKKYSLSDCEILGVSVLILTKAYSGQQMLVKTHGKR
jgi:hypothetical protein